MSIESWRICKVWERLMLTLDAKEQAKCASKMRWFSKKMDEALSSVGLKLVNYERMAYDPGLPATPINLEDFSSDEKLYIAQMFEPVIMDNDGNVIKSGTFSLGRYN